jgi:hypothetical protein
VANHTHRRLDARVGEPAFQAWLAGKACETVAEMLQDSGTILEFDLISARSGDDFATTLMDHELGLIADGERPFRISFRIELIRAAREALMVRAEIRDLPEARPTVLADQATWHGHKHGPTCPNPSRAGVHHDG